MAASASAHAPAPSASASGSGVAPSAASRSGGGGGASGGGSFGGATLGGGAGAGGSSGSGNTAGLQRRFNLPQLSIMGLPVSGAFAEAQERAQDLLDYHTAKHGGFPRPCPRCHSSEFMVRSGQHTPSAASSSSSSSAAPATSAPATEPSGPVVWRSRPLVCGLCGGWVHLGCAGVELAEDVPPQPWFHSRECRDTFLRLEATAQRNPHPSVASPGHKFYLLTPSDHNAAAAAAVATAAMAAAAGRPAPSRVAAVPEEAAKALGIRGPAGEVVPLLAQGFNADAIDGFGDPSREYDGGRYSAVLVHGTEPVAAASFNVWGADAQLCLVATAERHRRRGNAAALVADLETALSQVGVRRLLVQARGGALPLWTRRFGFRLLEPGEAAEAHRALPVAYYDCALLAKELPPPPGPQEDVQ